MSLSPGDAYERYAEELVRFATGLVGPDDAQDLVAEAFVRALRSKGWEQVGNHRSYLYRVVVNESRMRYRTTMRRRARERRAADPPVSHEVEIRPEILDAIGRLSPRQRAVIVLTYWEDLRPTAVAQRLGTSEGAVRKHLARARATLRKVLDA